jgi:MinD superfamily P-loop ATPase
MGEPEVALVFTPEPWVEDLHRHLTDHGGGRVRQVVVEPSVALEESYDILVAGHRWPALTRAFVADVHARRRAVLGVFDREEPAARAHLVAIGVDQVIESDRSPDAFVDAMVALHVRRDAAPPDAAPLLSPARRGRVVVVGGPPGAGRTEVAVHLAAAIGDVLVDADDAAPCVAPRLGLPIEPNLRTAIDAVEHGRGDVRESLVRGSATPYPTLVGLPNANGWAHLRPGEVIRAVERLAVDAATVVVDCAASLEDVGGPTRGRNAVTRALVREADAIVGVCAATPVGVTRLLSWFVEARRLAADVPIVVAVNRAPMSRFRRGELFAEVTRSLPPLHVEFLADDRRVTDAVWDGRLARTGPFTRAVNRIGEVIQTIRCTDERSEPAGALGAALECAS